MNNRTTTENGEATHRFGNPPEQSAKSERPRESTMGQDNAMGTNIPPAGPDADQPFRRLSRFGSGTGQEGNRNRFDRNSAREYATQNGGEGSSRNYGPRRDTDTEQVSRMDSEGGSMSSNRGREYENDVYRERGHDQGSRGLSEGGLARGERYRQTEFDKNRDRSWDQTERNLASDRAPAGERGFFQGGRAQERPPQESTERKWWQTEAATVTDVMTKNVKTVDPDASIRNVAELMKQEDVGVVPVVRADGRLYGLITDRDIVVRGLAGDKTIDQCTAKDLATKDLEVASTHDDLSDVIDLMGRQQIRRVPVLDENDRLVGIISLGDIANRADYDDELQKALERISGRRSFWSRIWR